MPFRKGEGGRPRGIPNKATAEVRQLAQRLFDRDYWVRVKAELRERKLNPMIEAKLLAYAFGEPKQQHELSGPEGGPIPLTITHKYVAVPVNAAAR